MGLKLERVELMWVVASVLFGMGCGNADDSTKTTPMAPPDEFEPIPYCGDGKVSAAEACDDGNARDGDGCSSKCTVCGDSLVQGDERCDDGNDVPGDGCFNCKTPDQAIWEKQLAGYAPQIHPDGFFYALDGAAYDVLKFDQEGELVATWPGPLDGFNDASTWSGRGVYPLNDGGVLVHVGLGRGAVDVHLARYSSSGALNWASWLPHEPFRNSGDGRYAHAVSALGQTIAVAGLQHLGAGAYGNTALISLLDPDGVERKSISYAFNERETQANDVLLLSDDQVCAGGSQWLAEDHERQSGWVACWGADLLWQRSFDKPVLALRRLDDATLDVMTDSSWSTVQLADGATSNRREGAFGAQYYSLVVGGNTLYNGDNGARLVDNAGTELWSSPELKQVIPAGLTATGSAYFSSAAQSSDLKTTLFRFETGASITADPPPTPTLAAPTIDISQGNAGCKSYCSALFEGLCKFAEGFASLPECITFCARDTTCLAELSTLGSCLETQGSLTCANGSAPQISGCDDENAAYNACVAAAP